MFGIDYNKSFASILRFEFFCLILSLEYYLKWKISPCNISNIYLNGNLEEIIYIEIQKSSDIKDLIMKAAKLKKKLYGLKQEGWI